MERSRLLANGTVLAIESLPPSWAAKISSSLSAATGASAAPSREVESGEVELAGMIVSMDTSLSPGAHRGRTALGCWGTVVPEMVWGKLRGRPRGGGPAVKLPEVLALAPLRFCHGRQRSTPGEIHPDIFR